MHPAKVPSVFITFKRRSFCAASRDVTWCDEEMRGRVREGGRERERSGEGERGWEWTEKEWRENELEGRVREGEICRGNSKEKRRKRK
jgi:hypothetical protein